MVSRSASISSRILSLSVIRMCGIDSAALIWLVIAVSFFRNSSSRSSEEEVACTVISLVSEVLKRITLRPVRSVVAILLALVSFRAAADTTTDRLAAAGRVWGMVKFAHPALGYRDVDWDAARTRA